MNLYDGSIRKARRVAYFRGKVAFKTGRPVAANPYAPHKPLFLHWRDGWRDAYEAEHGKGTAPIELFTQSPAMAGGTSTHPGEGHTS